MTVGTGTEVAERVRDVLGRHAVLAAYLFGSRVTGRNRPTSDVDVAILVGGHGVDRAAVAADVAQAVAPLRSDLLVLEDVPVAVAFRVLRDGRLLLSRDEAARTSFWARTVDRYLDMAPARKTLLDGTRRRLQEGRFGRP